MNKSAFLTRVTLPALVAVLRDVTGSTEPVPVTLKRDGTIFGKCTVLEHLNTALSAVRYTDRPVVVLAGCFFNGAAIVAGQREHNDRRRVLARLRTVRSDVAAAIPATVAECDVDTLKRHTATLKSVFAVFDLECFLHRCTSEKTSPEYRDGTVGPIVRRFVTYTGRTVYTVKLSGVADTACKSAETALDKIAAKAAAAKAAKAAAAKAAE